MSGYSGRFAQRNESAARDWAAKRQAEIQRAKQLREERKRGSLDQECTFAPQRFNSYEPAVGSSKLPGGVSEYSQEYLRDFHFQNHATDAHGAAQSGNGPAFHQRVPAGQFDPHYDQQQQQQQYHQLQQQGSARDESPEPTSLYALHRKPSSDSIGRGGPSRGSRSKFASAAGQVLSSGPRAQQQQQQQHPLQAPIPHQSHYSAHPSDQLPQHQQYQPQHQQQQQWQDPHRMQQAEAHESHYNLAHNSQAPAHHAQQGYGGQYQQRQQQQQYDKYDYSSRSSGAPARHYGREPAAPEVGSPQDGTNRFGRPGSQRMRQNESGAHGAERQWPHNAAEEQYHDQPLGHGYAHHDNHHQTQQHEHDPRRHPRAASNQQWHGDAAPFDDLSYEFAASSVNGRQPQRRNPAPVGNHAAYDHQSYEDTNGNNSSPVGGGELGGSSRLMLLKSQRARSGSAPGPREDASQDPPPPRTTSARARVGARASSSSSGACTRQSGCTCAQCNAHLQNESGPTETKRAPGKRSSISKRPPWNSETTVAESSQPLWDADTSDPSEPVSPAQPGPRPRHPRPTKPKRQAVLANRPKWQGIGGNDDGDGQENDTSAGGGGGWPGERTDENDAAERTRRMREELTGGKDDFIEQAQAKTSRPPRQNSMTTGPGSSRAGRSHPNHRQPAAQPEAAQSKPQVQYRGMYMPPAEHESHQPPRVSHQESPIRQRQQPQHSQPLAQTRQPQPQNRQPQRAPQAPHQQVQRQPNRAPELSGPIDEIPVGAGAGGDVDIPEYAAPVQLVPCGTCGRKFGSDRIAKHEKVCQKSSQSKRKVFDMSKARLKEVLEDPNDAKVVQTSLKETKPGRKPAVSKQDKKSKWKMQSQMLREAMKYNHAEAQAKKEGRSLSSIPPMVSSMPEDDLVPCPHCKRTFNEKAAERHIPKCSSQKAKPTRLIRGSGAQRAMRGGRR